jgi:TolB protein
VTGDIYVVNTDGTGLTNLTNDPEGDGWPAWSPDGSKIAFLLNLPSGFHLNREIYIMNPDGTGQINLTNDPLKDNFLHTWSPDSSKIAYLSRSPCFYPCLSPFEIFVLNADGTGQTNLTNDPAYYPAPVWSPDGSKIAYSSSSPAGYYVSEIYVMNADGTDKINLTNHPARDNFPAWRPQP